MINHQDGYEKCVILPIEWQKKNFLETVLVSRLLILSVRESINKNKKDVG